MIGRNDVTGTRDVKITQFPRSPWRSAVASSKSERRLSRGWAVSFSCLSIFFFKKFQFPFLASLRFLFVSATLTYSWQPTSVACRSSSEVAPLLESSKPRVAHRSRRWRTQRKGRRRRRKQGSACFEREREREREGGGEGERERERERERETNEANKSQVLLSISCGASCFSLTSRRAGIHAREWKQNWDYATSFSIRPATSGYHSLWTDKIRSLCARLFAATGTATRELDLRCSDVDSNFSTASRHSTCLEQERSGDRMFARTTAPSL